MCAEIPSESPNDAAAKPTLFRLFRAFFLISLCVVGGGYAILMVADDVFGRKLKWLRPGELLERLPIFQMVPGLIAGNTAMYVGYKTAGRLGAGVGLLAVALPSFAVFLCVSAGYAWLPVENRFVAGALLGLRAALAGVIAGTLARSWRRTVSGWFGYAVLAASAVVLVHGVVNPAWVMLGAMAAGVVRRFCACDSIEAEDPPAMAEPAASRRRRATGSCIWFSVLLLAALLAFSAYGAFVKFGLLCFGGGFPLVPLYVREFVGETAPLLQLPLEEFSNFIALTQATPGPVSVNAATFFGFRLGGFWGAAAATAGLLAPSYLLTTAAFAGIGKWRRNAFVQGVFSGVRPATGALLASATATFASMSVWNAADGWRFSPFGCVLASAAAACVAFGRAPVMVLVFGGAILGAIFVH